MLIFSVYSIFHLNRMRNAQRAQSTPDLVDRPETPASTIVNIFSDSFGGGTPNRQEEYELENQTLYSPIYPQIGNANSTGGYDNDESHFTTVPL